MTTKKSMMDRKTLKINFSIFLLQRKIVRLTKKNLPTDSLCASMRTLEASLAIPAAKSGVDGLETAYPLGWDKNENFIPEFK